MSRMTERRFPASSRLRRRILAACAVAAFTLSSGLVLPGHAQQSTRAKTVGKRLMCMCGCKQILTECNHVGCPMSAGMLQKLEAAVASRESDDLIVQGFVQEFGQQVMAEPPAKGFNALAWWMPGLVVLVGGLIVRTVLLRWRQVAPATRVGAVPSPEMLARVRREAGEEE
jgi:cytochrome c-type biogenesis protein CcmH/NrfF